MEHVRVLQNRWGTNRSCRSTARLPAKRECWGDGIGDLPCFLLALDVLERIHPFALHVASRGGGELTVPGKGGMIAMLVKWAWPPWSTLWNTLHSSSHVGARRKQLLLFDGLSIDFICGGVTRKRFARDAGKSKNYIVDTLWTNL